MPNFRSFSDDELSHLYERRYRWPAFHGTPGWVKILVGAAVTLLPILGITSIGSMLTRAPGILTVFVCLGAIGFIGLFMILKVENRFLREKEAAVQELVRRGLYERIPGTSIEG